MTVYAAIAVAFVLTCLGLTIISVLGMVNQRIEDAIRRVDHDPSSSRRTS